jgi:hypothetical protein
MINLLAESLNDCKALNTHLQSIEQQSIGQHIFRYFFKSFQKPDLLGLNKDGPRNEVRLLNNFDFYALVALKHSLVSIS